APADQAAAPAPAPAVTPAPAPTPPPPPAPPAQAAPAPAPAAAPPAAAPAPAAPAAPAPAPETAPASSPPRRTRLARQIRLEALVARLGGEPLCRLAQLHPAPQVAVAGRRGREQLQRRLDRARVAAQGEAVHGLQARLGIPVGQSFGQRLAQLDGVLGGQHAERERRPVANLAALVAREPDQRVGGER